MVDRTLAQSALLALAVDQCGLDAMDKKLLLTIIEKFDGGPVGIDTLASAIGEEAQTLEDVYEPFLLQQGFLHRTPRGRVASRRAYEHFGLQFFIENTDGATTNLHTIDDHVISIGAYGPRVSIQQRYIFRFRTGKRMVHGMPALVLIIKLQQWEIDYP